MNRIALQLIFLALIGLVLYYGYLVLSGIPISTMDHGNVKEFTIRAFQYGFDPPNITVNHGDTVIINEIDVDVPHGIGITEFGVIARSPEIGKPVTVRFVADKAGTFLFYCTVFCGEGHEGMVTGSGAGKLIVLPA